MKYLFYGNNAKDRKGSVTVLATKRSAGVAPDVDLRNPLDAGDKVCKGPTLALKHRTDMTRSQNRSISGPAKRKSFCDILTS